jgi:hypothetical protein
VLPVERTSRTPLRASCRQWRTPLNVSYPSPGQDRQDGDRRRCRFETEGPPSVVLPSCGAADSERVPERPRYARGFRCCRLCAHGEAVRPADVGYRFLLMTVPWSSAVGSWLPGQLRRVTSQHSSPIACHVSSAAVVFEVSARLRTIPMATALIYKAGLSRANILQGALRAPSTMERFLSFATPSAANDSIHRTMWW